MQSCKTLARFLPGFRGRYRSAETAGGSDEAARAGPGLGSQPLMVLRGLEAVGPPPRFRRLVRYRRVSAWDAAMQPSAGGRYHPAV